MEYHEMLKSSSENNRSNIVMDLDTLTPIPTSSSIPAVTPNNRASNNDVTNDVSIIDDPNKTKNRKPNYTEAEKQLMISLIMSKYDIVENKSLERSFLIEKFEAWKEITARYNATIVASGSNLITRDMDDLRNFWKNTGKKKSKL